VRAGAAALAEPDLAEREVDLVEDHEERVRREPVAIEQLPDRAPAVVHERLRTRDRDANVAKRALGDARIRRLLVEFEASAFGQPVGDLEADVVARAGVAVTRVAEPDDEAIDAWRGRAFEELCQTAQRLAPPLSM
jgi:hypothetical protein